MNCKWIKAFSLAILVAFGIMTPADANDQIIQPLESVKWGPAPPALPPGSQMVVLSGNPEENSAYTLLVKFPAKYQVPAHSHPGDENLTILSGTLYIGMGDKLDTSAGKGLGAGGYALMPANMNHYVYSEGETIFTVHGQGPIGFKYVNPADDPRNKK